MSVTPQKIIGYLPDERPPIWKLLLFAFQQILVMFPATVLVALLTGFHVETTIFAAGFATLGFILVTRGKIPLFYGSSFSYIAAIVSITGVKNFGEIAKDSLISQAQFGIILSGLVSIAAGLVINAFGPDKIERVLPPTVTGSIAIVIGISLAGAALNNAVGTSEISNYIARIANQIPGTSSDSIRTLYAAQIQNLQNTAWIVAIVTLVSTIVFSVYLKGTWGQLPILFGMLVGYALGAATGLIDFGSIFNGSIVAVPHFTLPVASWTAVLAIMPIAIATIPESTAHLYQLDIYVDHLAEQKGKKPYGIKNRLGWNLIGDGIGDMISSMFGGPAGTNYGENLSTMAIMRNFSVPVLVAAAVITMVVAFFSPLTQIVNSIPGSVIGGVSIYLFGVIGAQGIAIMINRKVDLFSSKNLAVIATILVIGLGGSYVFSGMIPFFGISLPAIATAALVGIVLNLVLSIGKKHRE